MVPVTFLTAAERCSRGQMTPLFNDTNIYALAKLEQQVVLNSTFVQSVYWHRMLEELTDSFRVKSPEILHRVDW